MSPWSLRRFAGVPLGSRDEGVRRPAFRVRGLSFEFPLKFPMMKDEEAGDPLLLDEDGEGGAPASLLCPITQELMIDPVIAADGFTYERSAIERWLNMGPNRRSPTTNAALTSRTLTPNRSLSSMISAYFSMEMK